MRGIAIPSWCAAGALGLGLALGCSNSRPTRSNEVVRVAAGPINNVPAASGTVTAVVESTPTTGVALAAPRELPASIPIVPKGYVPEPVAVGAPTFDPVRYQVECPPIRTKVIPPVETGEVVAAVRTVPAPGTAKADPKPVPAAIASSAWTACDDPAPKQPAAVVQAHSQPNYRGAMPAKPTSAPSAAGHASEFSWVRGEVSVCRRTKTWRLRYLPVDQTDPFGGSVTLVGSYRQLAGLRDGQFLTVRGQLCHPGQEEVAPPYRIEAIEPATRAN